MEKKLKDYLHLYLGCDCIADGITFKLNGVQLTDTGTLAYDGTMIDFINQCWWVENADFKMILRSLESMTEEEALECWKLTHRMENELIQINGWQVVDYYRRETNFYEAVEFHYLLSKHFDLFGLIDAGIAIEKK